MKGENILRKALGIPGTRMEILYLPHKSLWSATAQTRLFGDDPVIHGPLTDRSLKRLVAKMAKRVKEWKVKREAELNK